MSHPPSAVRRLLVALLLLPGLLVAPVPAAAQNSDLLVPGERNEWATLSTHDEVTSFYRELQARSPHVRTLPLARSREGRELLLVTVANPAVATPAQAHASGRPIVFIGAQVHGNEPGGKEGLMLFARDLAVGPLQELLDEVVFVFVPQINPDAAEADTVGTRLNPAGYNLNRDYVRLENPETRAFVARGIARWDPHVLVDAHEAFGPPRYYDFYTSYPRNVYGPQATLDITRDEALPAVVQALEREGFNHYFYHVVPSSIAEDPAPPLSRGGWGARSLSSYGGPHGAITFLFESLRQRDPRPGIERRARMHRVAMEGLARWVADEAPRVLDAVQEGRREMVERGSTWDAADSLFIDWRTIVTREAEYRVWIDDEVVERTVPIREGGEPTMGRIRPVGYVIEAHRGDVARHLALHGITVERVLEPGQGEVESFEVDSVSRADSPYEGYIPREVRTSTREAVIDLPPGSWIVRAGQPRAGLLFHMLEPEDDDSLASAGWFTNHEAPGRLLPVHRLRRLPQVPTQVLSLEER